MLLSSLSKRLIVNRLNWINVLEQDDYRLPCANLHSVSLRVRHGCFLVLDGVVEFKEINNEFLDSFSERDDSVINFTSFLHMPLLRVNHLLDDYHSKRPNIRTLVSDLLHV